MLHSFLSHYITNHTIKVINKTIQTKIFFPFLKSSLLPSRNLKLPWFMPKSTTPHKLAPFTPHRKITSRRAMRKTAPARWPTPNRRSFAKKEMKEGRTTPPRGRHIYYFYSAVGHSNARRSFFTPNWAFCARAHCPPCDIIIVMSRRTKTRLQWRVILFPSRLRASLSSLSKSTCACVAVRAITPRSRLAVALCFFFCLTLREW